MSGHSDGTRNHGFSTLAFTFGFMIVIFGKNAAANFTTAQWNTAIKLSAYSGYQSIALMGYNVPEQADILTFSIEAKSSGEACTFQEVHVYLQQGGYPLANLYNETFPDNFHTNRTDSYHLIVKKNNGLKTLSLSVPLPGRWYLGAFLPKQTSDKIQQKGLDKSCLFGMVVAMETRGISEVGDITPDGFYNVHLKHNSSFHRRTYRYMLPANTVSYTVVIDQCTTKPLREHKSRYKSSSSSSTPSSPTSSTIGTSTALSSNLCPVMVRIGSEVLPWSQTATTFNCSGTSCQKEILSPTVGRWTYIDLMMDRAYNVSEIMFTLQFELESCGSIHIDIPQAAYDEVQNETQNDTPMMPGSLPQGICLMMNPLGRFTWNRQAINVTFVLATRSGPAIPPMPVSLDGLIVHDTTVLVTSINVEDNMDTGGTLTISAELAQPTSQNQSRYSVLYVCLMKNAVPGGETVQACQGGIQLELNSSSSHSNVVYVPYPQAAVYYLGLNSRCYNNETGAPVACIDPMIVNLFVGVSGCVDGSCGRYGVCEEYMSGTHVFSACKCFAGWRGYGCTDGTDAQSDAEQLVAVLLLTLSNLFFLPAIFLAVYRRYFVEATVYVFTMFFSTFYHACDTSDLIYYCMVKYEVLSFSDFYGSIVSFWVTILAMANLGPRLRSFFHMLGVLGIAVGVEYDRHGLFEFAVPAGLAAVIMLISWVLMCRRVKHIYPPKRYYLTNLLPGILLAICGLVLFAFFETEENYKYTHSAWHVTVALSIVFLLPPRQPEKVVSSTELRPVSSATQILLGSSDTDRADYS